MRSIEILNVLPTHPGRGGPSKIVMTVVLRYLKSEPVEQIELSPFAAVLLIEQLSKALRVVGFER